MDCYTYYTDGAATMKNRNGVYLREAGGWAFISLVNDEKVSAQSGGCPLTTNNEMELYAIYASLRDFLDNSDDGDSVVVCSDSSYCIDIFTKWAKNWQRKGWKKSDNKPIKNLEIIKAVWDLMAKIGSDLSFKKVKGHSNNKLNNEVDKLAVEAKKTAKNTGKTTGYNQKPDKLLGNKQN